MATCPQCHANIPDGSANCPQCGAVIGALQAPAAPQPPVNNQVPGGYQQPPMYQQPPVNQPYQQPMYQQPPMYAPYGPGGASGQTNTGLLVWSIINLVLCCMPLGIAGLVMTLNAKNCMSMEEEQQKLKTAKTLNLIGTIGGAVVVVLYIVLIVTGALAMDSLY